MAFSGERGRHRVFLGLGSNLGDRAANLKRGLELLREGGAEPLACSGLYQTAPWGGVEQPDFYNMVLLARTGLAPRALLHLAKRAEYAAGRRPTVAWGPRVLDIDILLYDELTFAEKGLTIPHRELHRRAFVLLPLLELAPRLKLPGGASVAALAQALPQTEKQGVKRLADEESRLF